MVVTKGALTDAITTSNSGGHWGPELKFAGYDLVLIEGKAPRPVYLWIYDDAVQLRERRSDRLLVAHVAGQRPHVEVGFQPRQRVLVPSQRDHLVAHADEPLHDCASDPLRAAGHDDDSAHLRITGASRSICASRSG